MLKNKTFTLLSFLVMISTNTMANILPINGVTTGEISDSYPNLFAPAGVTFLIWGLIYLLLAVYVFYQFLPKNKKTEAIIKKINIFFIVSSIANTIWIFLWHYQMIGFSVLLMLVILYSLIRISALTNQEELSKKDKLYTKIPFGLYFGWITIAAIANVTTFFVKIGWQNLIFSDQVWAVIILLVGMVIASATMIKEKNLIYGLVPIWAYLGIYLKHTSVSNFNNNYPTIIITAIICIGIFIGVEGYLLIKNKSI
jgi:hypothetical protein